MIYVVTAFCFLVFKMLSVTSCPSSLLSAVQILRADGLYHLCQPSLCIILLDK